AYDDPILFDRDLYWAVTCPVLSVDRIVLDGGIEPQPVPLLAVVEGALERAFVHLRSAPGSAPPASPATSPPRPGRTLALLVLGFLILGLRFGPRFGPRFGLGLRPLGLDFGRLQLGRNERVVLSPQIDVLGIVRREGALGGLLVADELVLALELVYVTDRDV